MAPNWGFWLARGCGLVLTIGRGVLLSGELGYQCGSPMEGAKGEPGGSVAVALCPAVRLAPVIGGERHAWLVAVADQFRQPLAGRTVWNASSTALDTRTWIMTPGHGAPGGAGHRRKAIGYAA